MKKIITVAVCLFGMLHFLWAQDSKLLTEKKGGFKIVDWGVYTHYNCGFTKTETSFNFKKLNNIVEAVRKNPVMDALKGFDLMPTYFAQNCDEKFGYGIPSSVHFEFHTWSWYKKTGKEGRWDIEPPHWDIVVNDIRPFGNGQSYAVNRPYKDDWKKALILKNGKRPRSTCGRYFTPLEKKKH